jgi:hypothetical protein
MSNITHAYKKKDSGNIVMSIYNNAGSDKGEYYTYTVELTKSNAKWLLSELENALKESD